MREGEADVAQAGGPVLLHRAARELVVLRLPLVAGGAVDQLHDVVERGIGGLGEHARLGQVAQLGRQLLQEAVAGAEQQLQLAEGVGRGTGAAAVLDLLRPHRHLGKVARQGALRAPQVHLQHQRVEARARRQHPVQRRVGNQAAVPVELVFHLDGGEGGRQGAAGHHVLGADHVRLVVEIGEVAGAHVHRADAEAHLARVDAVEIHQPLQRGAQGAGVVEAGGAAAGEEEGRRQARLEEARHAARRDPRRRELIQPAARGFALPQPGPAVAPAVVAGVAHQFPELAQPPDAALGRVAGDDGAVDGADGDAGDPGGGDAGRHQPLVHAGLIGAERAAALQQQRDALEGFGAGARHFLARARPAREGALIHARAPAR